MDKKKFLVPESGLTLADSITVPFESSTVNLTANLSDENIIEENNKSIPISTVENVNRKWIFFLVLIKIILSNLNYNYFFHLENVLNETSANLRVTQTLHADETGTITLPNYSGEQTLTVVSFIIKLYY